MSNFNAIYLFVKQITDLSVVLYLIETIIFSFRYGRISCGYIGQADGRGSRTEGPGSGLTSRLEGKFINSLYLSSLCCRQPFAVEIRDVVGI